MKKTANDRFLNRDFDVDKAKHHHKDGPPSERTLVFDRNSDPIGSPVTPQANRTKLLAFTIYAKMVGTASVQEIGPGRLRIDIGGKPWKLEIDQQGRYMLSGFPNNYNLVQSVGKFDDEDPSEDQIIEFSDRVVELINKAQQQPVVSEPVFLPSTDTVQQVQGDNVNLPAPTANPFSGSVGADQPQQPTLDFSQPPPSPPAQPGGGMGMGGGMDQGIGQAPSGQPPMGGQPDLGSQIQPVQPPQQPQTMPFASKISSQLDMVAEAVQRLGMKDLAERIDLITNTLETI